MTCYPFPVSASTRTHCCNLTCYQLGYAAAVASGWRSGGPPLDRWDIGNLTQMYLGNLTATALAGGIPSDRVRPMRMGRDAWPGGGNHGARCHVVRHSHGCCTFQLYTHGGGTSMTGTTANIPFEAAFTAGTTPGWSVYKYVAVAHSCTLELDCVTHRRVVHRLTRPFPFPGSRPVKRHSSCRHWQHEVGPASLPFICGYIRLLVN